MRREAIAFAPILREGEDLQVALTVESADISTLYREDVIDFVNYAGTCSQTLGFYVEGSDRVEISPRRQRLLFGCSALQSSRGNDVPIFATPLTSPFRVNSFTAFTHGLNAFLMGLSADAILFSSLIFVGCVIGFVIPAPMVLARCGVYSLLVVDLFTVLITVVLFEFTTTFWMYRTPPRLLLANVFAIPRAIYSLFVVQFRPFFVSHQALTSW